MKKDPFNRRKYRRPTKREQFLSLTKTSLSPQQIEEKRILEEYLYACAAELDIRLESIRCDGVPEIETFFDVYIDGDEKLGYILKQWNSKMLRLGATIELRKDSKDPVKRFRKIHHICGVNHVSLLYPPEDSQSSVIKISAETALNLDGFNEDVFQEAVNRFAKCMKLIQPLLG